MALGKNLHLLDLLLFLGLHGGGILVFRGLKPCCHFLSLLESVDLHRLELLGLLDLLDCLVLLVC